MTPRPEHLRSVPTPRDEAWDSVEVALPAPSLRIEPGTYDAVCCGLRKMPPMYGRSVIQLSFDVFPQNGLGTSPGLGRVPMYVTLSTKRRLSPKSKLARLLFLAGVQPGPRVSLVCLRHKAWRIEVVDAQRDSGSGPGAKQRELPTVVRYSVVSRVVERLA